MRTQDQTGTLRRKAVDQMAIGGLVLLWGILLILRQIGILDRNMSTLPIIMAAFGLLLVIGGINRLNRARQARAREEAA
jgi:uncharacterized membrane protein HdeD (DUF308 family)